MYIYCPYTISNTYIHEKTMIFFLLFVINVPFGNSQAPTLNYFLPETSYNPAIPTPQSVLGYQVGDWHVTHDQLVFT